MVAWDKICRPKKLGGLGLRKTSAVNTAFVAKLSWKFLTQEKNYWVQQMRAKYCPPGEFFQYKKKQTDSWAWKCMLRARDFVKRGVRWKVGNGHTISFWFDNWCHELPLVEMIDPDRAVNNMSHVKVKEFITQDKVWDIAKLSQVLPQHLVKLVLAVPIPVTDMEDSFCWGFTGSGDFTIKSATWQAHENLKTVPESWKFKWIWTLDVMPKIRIFLWQLCHNALPTRAALLHKGIYIDPMCPACSLDVEDIDHLFVGCHMVKKTWDLAVSTKWLSSHPLSHFLPSVREGLHGLYSARDKDLTKVAILLWSLWKSRNALVFENEIPKPMGSLVRAKRIWTEWSLRTSVFNPIYPHLCPSPSTPKATKLIRWQSPPGGYIKINFDGTHSSSGAAAGFIIRDWRGRFIQAGTRFLEGAPILVAEATAMRDGLQAALALGCHNLIVEGDNQIVIQAIQGQIHIPWQIQTLIRDIRNMLPPTVHCLFQHTYREGNAAADWMAKYGCLVRSTSVSSFFFPFHREFLYLLMSDNLGRTLERRAA